VSGRYDLHPGLHMAAVVGGFGRMGMGKAGHVGIARRFFAAVFPHANSLQSHLSPARINIILLPISSHRVPSAVRAIPPSNCNLLLSRLPLNCTTSLLLPFFAYFSSLPCRALPNDLILHHLFVPLLAAHMSPCDPK